VDNRARTLAILNYEPYDRLPLVHFGYWTDTLLQWAMQGHISREQAQGQAFGNAIDVELNHLLGWDFCWCCSFSWNTRLEPKLECRVVEEKPDGSRVVVNEDGLFYVEKPGVTSLPGEIDHLLKGRKEWEQIFKPRLVFHPNRIHKGTAKVDGQELEYDRGGRELLVHQSGCHHYALYCGGLAGVLRDWLGLVNMSYLQADDEALFDEIAETAFELIYQGTKYILESGLRFDTAHFWEDICFSRGPMINPRVFAAKFGPKYRRITDLLKQYGVNLVSMDCDGKIDALLPVWIENGVNIMFPMEIGTWKASIKPWREKYGRILRGVGGVNKFVFGGDYADIDAEIERLRPLVDLGGYIPCPDHALPPGSRWENVQYYCERMKKVFGE
jgi:uroporphyrinogen decarboxylase